MKASLPTTPEATSTPAEVPPTPASVPAGPARWPEWFAALDRTALVLVLIAGFLAASFAARNSEIWLHLATGRLIAQGAYPVGGDPFSYADPARPWVNPSWLWDLATYAIYSLDPTGSALVAMKAVAFAAAFAFLLTLRQPGQPLWPWVVLIALGVMASAPHALLHPHIISMLFLTITLVAISHGKWTSGGWAMPARLAGLFAVWANCDSWFVLGPLTILLVLVGELLQQKMTRPPAAGDAADDPFPPSPPVSGLARALGIGVLACLLNPTFLMGLTRDPLEAFAQLLPQELGLGYPAELSSDAGLAALTLSPLSARYMEEYTLGYSPNGLAAAILLVGGALTLAAGFARLRPAHVVLWVGFAALALVNYRLIPFFTLVAVPLAAGHLNGLSARFRIGARDEQRTQILLTACGLGRILTVAAAATMALAAWPGWLLPKPIDPAQAPRVNWAVEPEPGLVRTATMLQRWRDGDAVPDAVRGIMMNPDIASYCAWFAPKEKVFVNGRFAFHRSDLAELVRLRKAVGSYRTQTPDHEAVIEACRARGAGYLVVSSTNRTLDVQAPFQLAFDQQHWRLWHLDGRSAVLGLSDVSGPKFDPVRLAFGPDQMLVPEGKANPPQPPAQGLIDEFLERPPALPADADDAAVWSDYARFTAEMARRKWQIEMQRRLEARAAMASVTAVAVAPPDPQALDDDQLAYPVLVLRAARRAAAVAPDRPEPYFALIAAYDTPFALAADGDERQHQLVTAVLRCLNRLPALERGTVSDAIRGFILSRQLLSHYQNSSQFDLAREAMRRVTACAEVIAVVNPAYFRQFLPPETKPEELGSKFLEALEKDSQQVTDQAARRNTQYERRAASARPAEQFQLAMQAGLPGKAIDLFHQTPLKDFQPHAEVVAAAAIMAQFRAGRLEAGVTDLLDDKLKELVSQPPAGPTAEETVFAREQLRQAGVLAARLAGDYRSAIQSLVDGARGRMADRDLPPTVRNWLAAATPTSHLAIGSVASGGAAKQYFDTQVSYRQLLMRDTDFFFNCAVLALCEGNVAEARSRLEQAAKPQGVDVEILGNPARASEVRTYLRLLRTAGR